MFDSDEELYFSWYLDELKQAGYIEEYTLHHKSYKLSDVVTYPWNKELVTKTKVINQTLLQDKIYTPDFRIQWNPKAHLKLFAGTLDRVNLKLFPFTSCVPGFNYSIIEIKPTFDQNNMEREFRINQKWTFQRLGIYVQMIKPLSSRSKKRVFKGLFEATFTPKEYLLTDGKTRARTLHYKPKTIKEYIGGLK